jgi:hypothetical protein
MDAVLFIFLAATNYAQNLTVQKFGLTVKNLDLYTHDNICDAEDNLRE